MQQEFEELMQSEFETKANEDLEEEFEVYMKKETKQKSKLKQIRFKDGKKAVDEKPGRLEKAVDERPSRFESPNAFKTLQNNDPNDESPMNENPMKSPNDESPRNENETSAGGSARQ
jgi:hypothetical protein